MKHAPALLTLGMLLLAVAFAVTGAHVYPDTRRAVSLIAAVTVFSLALQLLMDVRPDWADYLHGKRALRWLVAAPATASGTHTQPGVAALLPWVILLPGLVVLTGVGPGTSVFLVLALALYSRVSWTWALLGGAGLMVVLHFGLNALLGIRVYDGVLWRLL